MTFIDNVNNFRQEIQSHGWDPGSIYADGRFHRFDTDKPKDKAGWYKFFGEAGVYGSWKGEKYKWSSRNGDKWDAAKKAEYKAKMEAVEKDREIAKAKAKKRAQFIWKKATEATDDHAYLKAKGVKGYGLRQYKGALVVPLRNHEGELESVQFISGKGKKRFLKDGNMQGNFFEIPGNDQRILCEGYATGASIHGATGATVTVAFNCGNLESVIESDKHKWSSVIAADNDALTTKPDGVTPWNPGLEKALLIGWKHGCQVAIPVFRDKKPEPTDCNGIESNPPNCNAGETEAADGNEVDVEPLDCTDNETKPTDFNDLHQLEGIEAVKKQIEAAKSSEEWLLEECQEDKGAVFRPEHVEGLQAFKQRNLPGYRNLRHKLKKLQVGICSPRRGYGGKRGGWRPWRGFRQS